MQRDFTGGFRVDNIVAELSRRNALHGASDSTFCSQFITVVRVFEQSSLPNIYCSVCSDYMNVIEQLQNIFRNIT